METEVKMEVHPTINSAFKFKHSNSGLDNTIPDKDKLPTWVKGWGERVSEAWKWQWKADAPERDFEKAVEMLKSVVLGAQR